MKYHPSTRRPPRPAACPAADPDRPQLVHYDPRTLDRTATPLAVVAVVCERCHGSIAPDEARRDLAGNLVCADADACDLQVARNRIGGW